MVSEEEQKRQKIDMVALAKQKPDLMKCLAKGEGDFVCNERLTKAHILTALYPPLKANETNYLIICENHRDYFNTRVYYIWYRFVKKIAPEKFAFVIASYDKIMQEYKYILEVAKEQ